VLPGFQSIKQSSKTTAMMQQSSEESKMEDEDVMVLCNRQA
jgi:hypothetical protein